MIEYYFHQSAYWWCAILDCCCQCYTAARGLAQSPPHDSDDFKILVKNFIILMSMTLSFLFTLCLLSRLSRSTNIYLLIAVYHCSSCVTSIGAWILCYFIKDKVSDVRLDLRSLNQMPLFHIWILHVVSLSSSCVNWELYLIGFNSVNVEHCRSWFRHTYLDFSTTTTDQSQVGPIGSFLRTANISLHTAAKHFIPYGRKFQYWAASCWWYLSTLLRADSWLHCAYTAAKVPVSCHRVVGATWWGIPVF